MLAVSNEYEQKVATMEYTLHFVLQHPPFSPSANKNLQTGAL
jgi:hypothetical protein